MCDACKRQAPDGTWRAPGCPACSGTGTAGRLPLAELLVVSESQRRLIAAKSDPAAFEAQARADGMTPLAEAAARAVAAGSISEAEARRAVHAGG